ncbi:MAG: TonB-dependent receptor [Flavobacteriaceae bacterium]|nr:TonB-dependent receptor [Flavobacteriaceae bacterium]
MKQLVGIFVFLCVQFVFAQQITVLNLDTGFPIPNVLAANKDQSVAVVSDPNGVLILDAFDKRQTIYLTAEGFISRRITKDQMLKKGPRVYLTQTSQQLDEVVLSVSKWEQQKKDIPHKIHAIGAQEILGSGAQTAADVLQKSGAVFVQKSQLGGGSPMIRGFATNRVLLAVDGVRMNNAIFRGGNVQNVISIDPYTIKNTEVIFGPGSVIFGSDAMGGVMNFFTKDPQLSSTQHMEVDGSVAIRHATANNERTGHVELHIGKKQWAYFGSVSYNSFEDVLMGRNGPESYLRKEYAGNIEGADVVLLNDNPRKQKNMGYDQWSLLQKLRYVPQKNLQMDLGLYYSATSDYNRYDRLLEYENDQLKYAQWYYGPQRWGMVNFRLFRKSNSDLHDALKLTAAYQFFEESRHDRKFAATDLRSRTEKIHAPSVNLDFEKQWNTQTKLFYGLEYVYNKVHSSAFLRHINTQEKTTSQSRYPEGSSWQTIAAYTNIEYKAYENLTLLAGARYSHVFAKARFEDTFFDFPFEEANLSNGALTGSLGLSWFPGNKWQLTFNAATGFRSPNIDDIGKVFDSEPGAVVVPNPSLEPEYAYNFDIGIKKNFNEFLFWDASLFYSHIVDILVRDDFAFNGAATIEYDGVMSKVQAVQNGAKAYVYGLEMGFDLFLHSKFSLLGRMSYAKGAVYEEIGPDSPLRHVAPLFGNVHLVWKNHRLKFDVFSDFNGAISSEKLAASEKAKSFIYATNAKGELYSPSWYTINMKTEYQIRKNIKALLLLENLTDQRYRPYSSGIVAPGLNFILGLNYGF